MFVDLDRAPRLDPREIPVGSVVEIMRVCKYTRATRIRQAHLAALINRHAAAGDVHSVAAQYRVARKTDAACALSVDADEVGGVGAAVQAGVIDVQDAAGVEDPRLDFPCGNGGPGQQDIATLRSQAHGIGIDKRSIVHEHGAVYRIERDEEIVSLREASQLGAVGNSDSPSRLHANGLFRFDTGLAAVHSSNLHVAA